MALPRGHFVSEGSYEAHGAGHAESARPSSYAHEAVSLFTQISLDMTMTVGILERNSKTRVKFYYCKTCCAAHKATRSYTSLLLWSNLVVSFAKPS
jgi:hypothetical protein